MAVGDGIVGTAIHSYDYKDVFNHVRKRYVKIPENKLLN